MAISLTHTFVSGKSDGADSTLVQPSNWNEQHNLTCASGVLIGRYSAGSGAAEEISLGSDFSATGGTLSYSPTNLTVTTLTATNITYGGTDMATVLAGKVDVAGDTMTGDLTMTKSAPSIYLDDTSGTNIRLYSGSDLFRCFNSDGSQHMFYSRASNGDFYAYGNVTAYSDERLKENVQPIPDALETVSKLNGVTYNRIGEEERQMGVLAQQVQPHVPEVVKQAEGGYLAVTYGNMVALLIESTKELHAKMIDLEQSNKTLLARVAELEDAASQ